MITDFKIPEQAKLELKKPQGKLVSEKEIRNLKGKVIAVGDRITLNLIERKIEPDIAILDYKIERKPINKQEKNILDKLNFSVLNSKNKAGFISLDSWNKIKQALESGKKTKILIEGEEDLLALACILLSPEGSNILYGQPGAGIVLWKATLDEKQKWAEFLIKEKALEFLEKLDGKTVILHHSDADGCCSAALFMRYLKNKDLPIYSIPTEDPAIHENFQREVENLKPKNLIILDLGTSADSSIKKLASEMKVIVIDHHKLQSFHDFGKALFLDAHMFNLPEERVAPASYLAYKICKLEDWVAAIGIIGDKGFESCKSFLDKTLKKYRENFEELKDMINAADCVGKAENATEILFAASEPKDLYGSVLEKYHKEIKAEVFRLVKEHEDNSFMHAEKPVLVYEIKSEHSVRGTIANKLQDLYPKHVIVIGEKENSHMSFSFRAKELDIDLVKILGKSIKGFKTAHSGGHSKAAGCKILYKDSKQFIERFIKSLEVSEPG